MTDDNLVLDIRPLGFSWEARDPFLFCVHHQDAYPAGNDALGPAAPLSGRDIGQDFTPKDGWRMYHGASVPGFPAHPHRGFETVTVVTLGVVDHSDSHGAAGRYGNGDVQWMTAGAGLQHAEMFPLLRQDRDNPLELFQIWLNLPGASKFVRPHYRMLWADAIPTVTEQDADGRGVSVTLIAGRHGDARAPEPAPDSWAANPANEVAVWLIRMSPDARWTLPPAAREVNRTLYFYKGASAVIAGRSIAAGHAVDLRPEHAAAVVNGEEEAFMLLLQGRPIGEPVVQYGPFVMNTQQDIRDAFEDYRRTGFGGWPWDRDDPVHPRSEGRFARYADGTTERKSDPLV